MDKEKLLAALYAMQNGEKDAGYFHDELETLIGFIVNAKGEDITAAWEEIRADTE